MQAKPYQIKALSQDIKSKYKAAFVYGQDLGVIEDSSKKIGSLITNLQDDFCVIKITKDQLKQTPSLLVDEGNALSFMGGRKLVWLKDGDEDCLEAINLFLLGLKNDSFLLINALNLTKSNALVKFCSASDDILTIPCYQEKVEEIASFSEQFLKRMGFILDYGVIPSIIARVGGGRANLQQELEKLVTYMGTRTQITLQDVEKIISDTSESTYDDFNCAIASGKELQVDKWTRTLLSAGENPATIVRYISGYFLRLYEGTILKKQGMGLKDISQKLLRPAQFNLKSPFELQCAKWTPDMVLKALDTLLETECQIKSSNYPVDVVLIRAITTITRIAHKLCG